MSFYEDLVMQTQINYSKYYHVYASGGTPYQLIYGSAVEDLDKLRLAMEQKLGYGPTGAYQIGAAIAANAGPRAVGVAFDIP